MLLCIVILKLHLKLKKIFSHDSPGFKEEIIKSNEFKFIKNKIIKTIPGSSLIGMMFENNENYYIVKSNKLGGLQQHNPFSWQVSNFDFIYLKEISSNSKYTCKALNAWIKKLIIKKENYLWKVYLMLYLVLIAKILLNYFIIGIKTFLLF